MNIACPGCGTMMCCGIDENYANFKSPNATRSSYGNALGYGIVTKDARWWCFTNLLSNVNGKLDSIAISRQHCEKDKSCPGEYLPLFSKRDNRPEIGGYLYIEQCADYLICRHCLPQHTAPFHITHELCIHCSRADGLYPVTREEDGIKHFSEIRWRLFTVFDALANDGQEYLQKVKRYMRQEMELGAPFPDADVRLSVNAQWKYTLIETDTYQPRLLVLRGMFCVQIVLRDTVIR